MGKLAVVGQDDVGLRFYVSYVSLPFYRIVSNLNKCKMETFLVIISVLSLLAFIVGMFRPTTVMCKSRGKVALIYLGIFFVCTFIGASIMKDESSLQQSSLQQPNEETNDYDHKTVGKIINVPLLSKGMIYTMNYGNGDVKITFDNIQIKRIPNGGINLIITLIIKNNSNDTFFVSNCNWKLLDSDKIEVEEAGIYEPMFDGFTPSMFFFTTVEPNIGKKEEVGYSVKKETYYLSINGEIVAKIPIE